MCRVVYISVCCAWFLALFAPDAALAAEERIALVVGVSQYGGIEHDLPNAANDAKLIHTALEASGFKTRLMLEPTKGQLREAVQDLTQRIIALTKEKKTATVAFYFAGHGTQFGGENYLLPTKTDLLSGLPRTADYEDQSVRAQWIVDKVNEAGAARILIILDACRTNPYRPDRRGPADDGFVSMHMPVGGGADTMIVFAAQPRTRALENKGGVNSFFTRALTDTIQLPGLDIGEVFDIVRERVWNDTQHRQRPHIEGFFRFTFKAAVERQQASMHFGIAQQRLAEDDVIGLLTEILKTRTIDELTQGMRQGDGFATYFLGLAHLNGAGGLSRNPLQASRLFRLALTRGVARAATTLGYVLWHAEGVKQNREEADEWFRVGVELGSAGSMVHLANSYLGPPGAKQDFKEAERLYLLALDRGLADAAIPLAHMYRSGLRGNRNVDKAIEILIRAGNAGCAKCWSHVASDYATLPDQGKRAAQITEAYRHGAEAGDIDAMIALARRLVSGEGTTPNPAQAIVWLETAYKQGSLTAAGELGRLLATDMERRDIQRANALLREVVAENTDARRSEIWPPTYWLYGRTLAQLYSTGAIANASQDEAKRLYARYGKGGFYSVTVQVDCDFIGKQPFVVYVIDWDRNEPSTDEQAEWVKAHGRCTISNDVIQRFRDLYKTAKETKQSFADLATRAFAQPTQKSTSAQTQ